MASILIFGCAAVVLGVVGLTMRSDHDILCQRVRRQIEGTSAPVDADDDTPFKERVILPFLCKLSSIGSKLTPKGTVKATEDKLNAAGHPWKLGVREFMGLKGLSIAVFSLLALFVAGRLGDSAAMHIAAFVLLISIGYILPESLLQSAISRRQNEIRRILPDTLDLLMVSVEAGLGMDGAMQKVVEKISNPLADEMNRALFEMRAGQCRADALKNMASRIRVNELSTFVAAVCQGEQLGVSICKVLQVQSNTMRNQRSLRARESAARLPVKMLFPLVFFIFPALFVVILSPGVIQIGRALGILGPGH